MANIMSHVQFKNKPSRSAFDLSHKVAFTAKAGELLPIVCQEVLPGDKFSHKPTWFTRTNPLNSAAYTRLTEYVDYYFVPYSVMWRDSDSFFTQTNFNQSAHSITKRGLFSPTSHPFMYLSDIAHLLSLRDTAFKSNDTSLHAKGENIFGFNRATHSAKLLEYLGYGDFTKYFSDGEYNVPFDFKLNPFPLLAYQCIYQYFERNQQWEDMRSDFFNIDYITGQTTFDLDVLTGLLSSSDDMFDLRYCNFKKDLFTGLLPNAQYGDESTASIIIPEHYNSYKLAQSNGSTPALTDLSTTVNGYIQGINSASLTQGVSRILLSEHLGNLPILALRQAETLQRYKEIKQSNHFDYKSQMQAIWDVNPSTERSRMPYRIGSLHNSINIDAIYNTSITDNGDERQSANIAGKGTGAGQGSINFTAQEAGVIMAIYKVVPELDYIQFGLPKFFTKHTFEDYANPLFDKIGMEAVPTSELISSPIAALITSDTDLIMTAPLGYAPRYYDYKTAYDRVIGGFARESYNHWTAPITESSIRRLLSASYNATGKMLNYLFFKVNPTYLNPIFTSQIGGTEIGNRLDSNYDNDQFLVNFFNDEQVVRNLDYNGLPY